MKKKEIIFLFLLGLLLVNINYFSVKATRQTCQQDCSLSSTITRISSLATWDWTTPEVITTESTSNSFRPSIAFDSVGNIHVIWMDGTDYDGAGSDRDIFYKYYSAVTSSWGSTIVVSTESTSASEYPSVATDSVGNVHVVWNDYTDYDGAGSDSDIFYRRYSPTTSTWGSTIVLSSESTSGSYDPCIALDVVGNIHVVWEDYTDYNGAGYDADIFHKRYSAAGIWGSTTVVSTESVNGSYNPSITLDAVGDAHVVWDDYTDYNGAGGAGFEKDIFYKRYSATADAWGSTTVVSTESTGGSYNPSITSDSMGNIHVVWDDWTDYNGADTDHDIFYKRYSAATSSWGSTTVVSTESTEHSYFSTIVTDLFDNLHLIWQDITDYNGAGSDPDYFYKFFNTTTSLWSTPTVISTESNGGGTTLYEPILGADTAEQVHLFWSDNMDYNGAGTDYDLFYSCLTGYPRSAPILAPITPNPSATGNISLHWSDVYGGQIYKIYRANTSITSTSSLTPIASVSSLFFNDSLSTEGKYFYAIVATNPTGNSSLSNVETVTVDFSPDELFDFLPDDPLFFLSLGLNVLLIVFVFLLLLKRK